MSILITGGSGYIGSHTCLQLSAAGYDPIILDNLHNSKASVVDTLTRLSGAKPTFYQGDIRDKTLLSAIFREHTIEAVIHFAGLKAVGESVIKPVEYYENNVYGTLTLIGAMRDAGVKNLIFSSSATVYGDQPVVPYAESLPTGKPSSPYGRSKLMVEQILQDLQQAEPEWSITLLRYFNPAGAHPCGIWVKILRAFPIILCPLSPRWRWAGDRMWRFSVMTSPPRTARVSGTIFMLWI